MPEEDNKISYPISQTGGRGYNFEDSVATRFLLAMIEGAELWGTEYGYITKIDWQTHADGWLFDDLLLTLIDRTGALHQVAISIKSNVQITTNGFPQDTTLRIWKQFLEGSPPFDADRDLLLFAVGEISSGILSDWTDIQREVSSADDKRISNRLAADGAWSKNKKVLFNSLACPDEKYKDAGLSICTIIRRLRIKSFDFLNATSDSLSNIRERALECCSAKSYPDGDTLLDKLLHLCKDKRGAGGSVSLDEIYNIPDLPDLVTHPNYHSDIALLQEISRDNVDLIQVALSNGITIPRKEICDDIRKTLADKKIVSVTGQSGIGKSAIVKTFYSESPYNCKLWLSNKDFGSQRLKHNLVSVIENLPTADVLIVFDSVERLDISYKALLVKLISIAQKCGFHVILTTTDPLSQKVESAPVEVPPLTADDLAEVFNKDKSLYSLWNSKGMNTLMCIPKILDWCIELLANSPMTTLAPVNFADHLWNKWIQSSSDDRYARSKILKEIAASDGDNLKSGVFISQISDASILGALEKDNLIYIKDELIFWKHDLIGDWARERILVENNENFLNFVKDKYPKPQWKHSILLFGQWLLSSPDGVEKWIKFIKDSKDELQYLLLDSIIFANRLFELRESIKNALLDKECELFSLLLNRLFLIASSKRVINGQTLPILNLRLALPFLDFINIYSEDIIPYCHHRISKICIYFLLFCGGTQYGSAAAKLAVDVAKFAYKNEKHIQVDKKHGSHLYLKNDALDEIWMSFLFAFQELPETVMKYSLVFAEIDDPEDENLKSLLSSNSATKEMQRCDFLVEQRYIPAWPNGPKRQISERFREVCLTGNVLNPFFDKYPDDATRLLMAVCIEAPHYSSPHHDLLSACGLDMLDRTDHACCYFIGPWLQLLHKHPKKALKIIIDLVNFATEQFVVAGKQDEQARARIGANNPLLKSLMEPSVWETVLFKENTEEQIVWIGDERVFGWYRNRLINSPIIPTILMALEKWLYDLVENKDNLDSHIDFIFAQNKSVAIAGVLCSLVKKHPALLRGKLKVLASAWQFSMWDIRISTDDTWKIGFGFYYRRLGETLYNKALEWNQMPHRKNVFRDIILNYLQSAIECGVDVTYFDAVAKILGKQDNLAELSQFLIAQLTPANYQRRQLSDGKVKLKFSYPSHLELKLTEDAKRSCFNLSTLTFTFDCRRIIENESALSDADAENIWNRMNEFADYAIKDVDLKSKSGIDDFITHWDIYCAGICTILHLNPDYIFRSSDKTRWVMDTVFQIYSDQPKIIFPDVPTMHLTKSWDSFIGEISVLLYKYLPEDHNTRALLAKSFLLFHYEAIKKSLTIARKELTDGTLLIELINLHIKYSFARGLLLLGEYWRDNVLHDFKDIGNRKICDYYNEFCKRENNISQILDIGKLHSEYLKIRDRELQFDVLLMLQSKNIIDRIYANIVLKIRHILNRRRINPESWLYDKQDKNFRQIYESRFLRQQICDFNQLVLVTDIVDFSMTEFFSYQNQFNLLVQIENIMLMPLRNDSNEKTQEYQNSNSYPDECERACLCKIASSLVFLNADEAKVLWKPIFMLDSYYHDWIDAFLSCFFYSNDESKLTQFSFIWKEMIIFAEEHWNAKNYDMLNLQLRLLGIYSRESFWTDAKFAPIIDGLSLFYTKWANISINKYNYINNYIAFCASTAGAPLLKDSLPLIADTLESIYLRDNEATSSLSAQLCKEIWTNHQSLIKENHDLEDAFFRILSKSISLGSREALDLQNEIINSSE